MIGFLWRERTIAGPGFNRRLIPPAALMVHLSIGKIYAFSVFKNPLVERFKQLAKRLNLLASPQRVSTSASQPSKS